MLIFCSAANILLLLLSLITLGKEKTFHSILGSLLYPGIIFLTSNITKYVHVEQNQILLSCLFAGILSGIGAGLIFKSGYTTGGTDILNQIISKIREIDAKTKGLDNPNTGAGDLMKELIFFILH